MMFFDLYRKKDFRFERKFRVENFREYQAEFLVKHNPLCFSELFHKRQVNNMYLDFPGLTAYNDNVLGCRERTKIRVRWYGDFFSDVKLPVLEFKTKQGEVNAKRVWKLIGFDMGNNFNPDVLHSEVFPTSNLPEYVREVLKCVKISLFNSYTRKYFISANKKYRITIDSNLKYLGGQSNGRLLQKEFVDYNNTILELKYGFSYKNDLDAQFVSNCFPFRLTKSSKYVTGVEMLNL